jgi:hypothetical protein
MGHRIMGRQGKPKIYQTLSWSKQVLTNCGLYIYELAAL